MDDSVLASRLRAALSADARALAELSTRDVVTTLLDVYALHLAPIGTLGGAEQWQHEPRIAGIKLALEQRFRARLGGDESSPVVGDVTESFRAIAHHDLVPPVYDWLADIADRADLKEFLVLEGGPDADFDDLVAMCQVGLSGLPKLTLAANYWDEMGRGSLAHVHTELHHDMVDALGVRPVPMDHLPLEALERLVVNGYLATTRALQPEMLGSLGLLEMQAGPWCRRVVAAMRRLGAAPAAFALLRGARGHRSAPRQGLDRRGARASGRRAPALGATHPARRPLACGREPEILRRDVGALRVGRARRVNERSREFGPLCVGYDDTVLAPRPWTIVQSRHAAALLDGQPAGRLLELHCGTGHIGQAASLWSGRPLVQIDDDPSACGWARRNAVANAVNADVRCLPLEALPREESMGGDESFALVLADPPYVPSAETARFADDPVHAIDGGPDGLDGIRAALPVAARLTRPGGAIVFQVRGPGQVDALGEVAADAGLDVDVLGMVAITPDRAIALLMRR